MAVMKMDPPSVLEDVDHHVCVGTDGRGRVVVRRTVATEGVVVLLHFVNHLHHAFVDISDPAAAETASQAEFERLDPPIQS